MIRHVVLLDWNEGMTAEALAAFEAGLRSLQDEIPEIRAYAFGPNLGLPASTADYVICADFDHVDGYVAYRDHPAHDRFRAEHLQPNVRSRSAAQLVLP